MKPLLFFTLVSLFFSQHYTADCTEHNQNKYPAMIYKISRWDIHFDGTKNVSCFTFCPASTEREKKINDQVSITGHSLFLRNSHGPDENITANICEKPIKPGMLYNSKSHQYEIGYELYYREDRFKWEDGAYYWRASLHENSGKYQLGVDNYHVYRPVKNRYDGINHDGNKKFLLNNGSSKWIFYWASVINITSSGDNKQIRISDDGSYWDLKIVTFEPPDEALKSNCDDYGLPDTDMKIYISSEIRPDSKKSKNQALPSIKKLKPWNGEMYGSLRLLQIIPLWYFKESWMKAASCSHMNMIPVWKTIADGQLRKVDLYILALERKIDGRYGWNIENMHFGTSGVLTYKNQSGIDSNQHREIYSSPDNAQFNQIIPVPKIIYRVIEAKHLNGWYNAIVVIHNDPNPIPDHDRICDESEEVWGWETIKNDDPRTGITYVCPYTIATIVEHVKLGFQAKSNAIEPLTLIRMRYYEWGDLTCPENFDATEDINPEFEKLLHITVGV